MPIVSVIARLADPSPSWKHYHRDAPPNGRLFGFVAQKLVLEWERCRSTKVSDEDRRNVISEISKQVKGKVSNFDL